VTLRSTSGHVLPRLQPIRGIAVGPAGCRRRGISCHLAIQSEHRRSHPILPTDHRHGKRRHSTASSGCLALLLDRLVPASDADGMPRPTPLVPNPGKRGSIAASVVSPDLLLLNRQTFYVEGSREMTLDYGKGETTIRPSIPGSRRIRTGGFADRVEVHLSPLSGVRRVVDAIFTYTNRNTDSPVEVLWPLRCD
jgi:hypothetical protein